MKQDTFGKLKFRIFLQELLFLKDLQGTRFKESHVVLKFKPLISVAYEHKKGGEKFLPKCGHIDVATLMWPSPENVPCSFSARPLTATMTPASEPSGSRVDFGTSYGGGRSKPCCCKPLTPGLSTCVDALKIKGLTCTWQNPYYSRFSDEL
jgi:hypothetical protein